MITEETTAALVDCLRGANELPYTSAQVGAELFARLVPGNDPVEEMRGGIRPTRPNL